MRDPATLREALQEVIDPCSIAVGRPKSLVDLGIIDEIVWDEGEVTVRLVLTDPACFFFRDLQQYIRDVLVPLEGVTSVEVEINHEKMWLPAVPATRLSSPAH